MVAVASHTAIPTLTEALPNSLVLFLVVVSYVFIAYALEKSVLLEV